MKFVTILSLLLCYNCLRKNAKEKSKMIKLVLLAVAAAGAFAAAKASTEEKKLEKRLRTEQRDKAALNDPTAKEYDMDYMYV